MTRSDARLYCLLAVLWLAPSRVEAQTHSWLILPARVAADEPVSDELVHRIAAELRERDITGTYGAAAKARFEARHSTEPSVVDSSSIATLPRRADDALVATASAHTRTARRVILPILRSAEESSNAMLRDDETATHVFNSCLYLVRTLLQERDPAAAAERAAYCRRLVPDLRADPRLHPPEVLAVFERAEVAAEAHRGSITIDAGRPGCRVFVNGRNVGVTPYRFGGKPHGEYQVQLECPNRPATRVYRLSLGEEDTRWVLDTRFDTVVDTGPRTLALLYANPEDENAFAFTDTLPIGRTLNADSVLLVRKGDRNGNLRIDRIDIGQQRVAASVLASAQSITQAVPRLIDGESADFTVSPPRPIEPWRPPPRSPSVARTAVDAGVETSRPPMAPDRMPHAQSDREGAATPGAPVFAWILGGAGVASLGVSWFLWRDLDAREDELAAWGDDLAGEFGARQRAVDDARLPPLATSIAGGVLVTASLPWLLPADEGVPWWSVLVGVAGAGVATAGIFQLTAERECINPALECPRRETPAIMGAMLLSHATPLLAVPMIYLLRDALSTDEIQVHARVDTERATLRITATF